MYNITLIYCNNKKETVKRGYSAKFYDLSESGELTLYGFNGTEEEYTVNIDGNPYKKAYIMNERGVTIDCHVAKE